MSTAAVEEEGPTLEEMSGWLAQSQDQYSKLALVHRRTAERLESLELVYRELYKKWWMRLFYLPSDALLEGRTLLRCRTCGGLFWMDGEWEFTRHKGHKYGPVTNGSWWENLALKMGKIK